jgi:phage tail-like protein
MARAQAQDFLHSMRFHVTVDALGGGAPPTGFLNPARTPAGADLGPEAGFSACSTPELSTEAVEYKEGTMVYTRKFPGAPSVSDITLSRGVARTDTSFWLWIKTVAEGDGEYRADLSIKHYHRVEFLSGTVANANKTSVDLTASPARTYQVKQAFPTRHKVAGDLDATASEISVMELDLAYEYFLIVTG